MTYLLAVPRINDLQDAINCSTTALCWRHKIVESHEIPYSLALILYETQH
jgi:hypothetical protein